MRQQSAPNISYICAIKFANILSSINEPQNCPPLCMLSEPHIHCLFQSQSETALENFRLLLMCCAANHEEHLPITPDTSVMSLFISFSPFRWTQACSKLATCQLW